MKNQELIKALRAADLLTDRDAERILRESESLKKSAEDIIYAQNVVPETEVAKVKSRLLKIPYKKVTPSLVSEDVVRLMPLETARTYKMVPIERTKDLLVVAMVNPDDANAQQALRFLAGQQKISLGVYLATPSDINEVLKRYSPFADEIKSALQAVGAKAGDEFQSFQKIIRLEEGLNSGSLEAPIIRIVSSLLKEAVNLKASDIHIEPGRSKTRVRLRLDGDLEEYASFPPELSQAIASRIKVLANLKLDETRAPQDGRFRTVIFEKEIDFRVATFPTPNGEKVALRVLDPTTGLKSLDDLGISGRGLEVLKAGIAKPYGMVLLTGPTGSGKTTTLYALMRLLNKEENNVLSLEDPVEYTIEGVNQSQVRPEIGYDFASGLRQILRQDPDVLMVGEIRDQETAGLAVHAALTGHIVLSTLHTNNAIGVIPRLIDMGVSLFLLPSAVNVMAAQRLISRLCQRCKKAEAAPPAMAQIIKQELSKLPASEAAKYSEPYKIFRAPGCDACKNKGISGRVAIFEIFEMSRELADMIVAPGFNENKILEEARRQGMVSLRQDGIIKALAGLVNIEEVLRETEEV